MSIRETELITPIDMQPVADSFLQAAFDGQVAVGQSQYYLDLDAKIAAAQEATTTTTVGDAKVATPEPVVEKGPQRSDYELQLIAEHAAAMALVEEVEKPQGAEEPAPVYMFESSAFYSSEELDARISQARRKKRMPWLNIVDYADDRLFLQFYGRNAGLRRR